jgi:hypothetical protein
MILGLMITFVPMQAPWLRDQVDPTGHFTSPVHFQSELDHLLPGPHPLNGLQLKCFVDHLSPEPQIPGSSGLNPMMRLHAQYSSSVHVGFLPIGQFMRAQ